MRRSQSAVEATADYLGTRVARLSYLNPDEAKRNIFIYRVPKRWTIKVIKIDHRAVKLPRCVCACIFFVFVVCVEGDTYGLKGDFEARQLHEMYRMRTPISAMNGRLILAVFAVKGPVSWAAVGLPIMPLWWPWKRSSWRRKHGLTGGVCTVLAIATIPWKSNS